MLHAARWKYRTQKNRKIRHLGTIAQFCWAISLQSRHVSTIGKKLLSSNISSRRLHNMVKFGPLAAEIGPVVWAPLIISTVSRPGSVTARHSSSGRQPNFAAWYKEWNYVTFAESATYIRPGGRHIGHLISGDWMSTILLHMVWP